MPPRTDRALPLAMPVPTSRKRARLPELTVPVAALLGLILVLLVGNPLYQLVKFSLSDSKTGALTLPTTPPPSADRATSTRR